jgi:hypothetical protein
MAIKMHARFTDESGSLRREAPMDNVAIRFPRC